MFIAIRTKATALMLLSAMWLGGCASLAPIKPAASPPALPPVCMSECVTPYGEALGTAAGDVTAYSNCKADCFVAAPNLANSVFLGIKWQCVEYARRWLYKNKGLVFGDVDTASDIWTKINHFTRPATDESIALESHLNGASKPPAPGDLIIYSKEYLNTGHVAVVTAVYEAAGVVHVAEQNFLNQRWPALTYARVIPLVRHAGEYWLLDSYVLGWKRIAGG